MLGPRMHSEPSFPDYLNKQVNKYINQGYT